MKISSHFERPLQGKRVLVTALDLEQREHRGIAVYSKALIRHLRRMGAEVWLLTQFQPIISDLRSLPKETQQITYSARTLNELVHGKTVNTPKLERLFPFLARFGNRYRRLHKGLSRFFGKTSFRYKEMKSDLESRTGLNIHRFDVGKINFLDDTATVRIYYYADDQEFSDYNNK